MYYAIISFFLIIFVEYEFYKIMAKRSTIIRNWPKYLLQWGVLAALVAFITGLVPSETAVAMLKKIDGVLRVRVIR